MDAYRCPICGGSILDLMRLLVLGREHVIGRDAPPEAIPDGAGVHWLAEPCGHQLTLVQLREAGLEPERYERG